MSKIGFLHTMRWARVVAMGACCALLSSLPQSASAQLNHGQWLQLNFTDGWNPADKNEFNLYTNPANNNNSSTANPADMIDSLGNLVPGLTLTTSGWQGHNWDGASNLAEWPAGHNSPTPANLAGRGDSIFRRDESINFWWDASIDTPPVITVHGLDPDLVYNVYYYSKHSAAAGAGESHTLDVNGILQTTLSRGDRFLDGDEDLFFSQVPVGLDGNLVFTWGVDPDRPAYNPVVTAILIQAVVPEPATIGLIVGAVTLLGVVKLRRKR